MTRHMKWWGWGDEAVSFDHHDKPALAPFVKQAIGIDLDAPPLPLIDLNALSIPRPSLPDHFADVLRAAVGPEHVHTTPLERIVHAYGKSLRDLVRVRSNDLGRIPDVVVYPASEAEVATVLSAALETDAVLIPFGGGTNIVGSLESAADEHRPVVSLDLARMDRVRSIDAASGLAVIAAGALGPDIETQLHAQGFTLGHFPDSFTHSTLGGWIATRSSGMQSDLYGDIAQITKAVRVVTPRGTLVTRSVPASSTGPSVREMVLGSEGRLGVITEATVQVHRLPAQRKILGYFFPDWDRGIAAMTAIAASDAAPSVTRVSDPNETGFSLATRKAGSAVDRVTSRLLRAYLQRAKRFDLSALCLSFIGFEGSPEHVKRQRSLVGSIVSAHGGVCVGSSPGTLYDQKKFDTPYIRDYLLDRGAFADVSETATTWSNLRPLYDAVTAAANTAFAEVGVHGYLMCHLAHSYHSGACLYFTFAFRPGDDGAPLTQYDTVKHAIQQAFIDAGGTLSHHHAVGREHAEWLADDLSAPGVEFIAALFEGVDPGRNLNPGAIIGSDRSPEVTPSPAPGT
jgi:alkyldihydroxyacetonephosphate synthase